jgi:hypothetical protein
VSKHAQYLATQWHTMGMQLQKHEQFEGGSIGLMSWAGAHLCDCNKPSRCKRHARHDSSCSQRQHTTQIGGCSSSNQGVWYQLVHVL